ncbi:hypothetical protein ACFW1A_08065 [Kitasatospora sp. NPDC058965]|uniref:hypothetical protein n=1 Tax=Kitasatospora sp. NPDC058965 TaxID=3346682 RepID=UPI0036A6F7A3
MTLVGLARWFLARGSRGRLVVLLLANGAVAAGAIALVPARYAFVAMGPMIAVNSVLIRRWSNPRAADGEEKPRGAGD